jgi:hypothetical protein
LAVVYAASHEQLHHFIDRSFHIRSAGHDE